MKEEIEEEFYRGLTREFKKRNDDCIAKQRLLYPNWERDRENSLFHSFPPSDSLYTSTKEQGDRERNWGKSFFHCFQSFLSVICYQFLEIVDLIFSVRKGYFNKITNFDKVWSKVVGVEEFESVISLSKLLTWFSQ